MNDRTAEKFYILSAIIRETIAPSMRAVVSPIVVESVREDTGYGTEAYLWRLSFEHGGDKISVESYSFSEAVIALWDAAEKTGILNDQFIVA